MNSQCCLYISACGCLVYLKNTPRTLNLWDYLSNDFRKRIMKGYQRGGMSSPDENEQEVYDLC